MNWYERLSALFSPPAQDVPVDIRSAFDDRHLQEQFDRDGFVVVPFIADDRRRVLLDWFATLDAGVSSGFYVSVNSGVAGHRVVVHEGLERICGDLPGAYLRDYRLVLGTFAVKQPGPDSTLGVHQDFSFVDESRLVSVNCWFPLTEVRHEDGPLMVMKGSHRLFPLVRGPVQPLFREAGLRDEIVARYLTMLTVKPGEAVLFNSRLVHYSPASTGSRPRVAVSLSMIPREATPRFCYTHPDGETELFEVPLDFFYQGNHRAAPSQGTSLGRVTARTPGITVVDIDRFYRRHPELR